MSWDETLQAGLALSILSTRLIRRHLQLESDQGRISDEEYAEKSQQIRLQKSMIAFLREEWAKDASEHEFDRFCIELCSSLGGGARGPRKVE